MPLIAGPNQVFAIATQLAASTSLLEQGVEPYAIATDLCSSVTLWQSEHPELEDSLRPLSSLLPPPPDDCDPVSEPPPPISRVQLAEALHQTGANLSAFSPDGDLFGGMNSKLQAIIRESRIPTPFAVAVQRPPLAATGSSPTRAKSPKGHETILIIDDEPSVSRAIKRQLEAKGYRVLTVLSGAEAVKLVGDWYAGETNPSLGLMIMDIHLKDIRGEDLIKRLRSIDPEVPCLFQSGGDPPPGLHNVERSSFVDKPAAAGEILAHLRRLIDGA